MDRRGTQSNRSLGMVAVCFNRISMVDSMGSSIQTQFEETFSENTVFIPGADQNETLEESRRAVETAAQSYLRKEDLVT